MYIDSLDSFLFLFPGFLSVGVGSVAWHTITEQTVCQKQSECVVRQSGVVSLSPPSHGSQEPLTLPTFVNSSLGVVSKPSLHFISEFAPESIQSALTVMGQ